VHGARKASGVKPRLALQVGFHPFFDQRDERRLRIKEWVESYLES